MSSLLSKTFRVYVDDPVSSLDDKINAFSIKSTQVSQ